MINRLGSASMELRDYFAAAALQGFCESYSNDAYADWFMLAEDVYKVADAMMEIREREQE
jgi:hypothetical protein